MNLLISLTSILALVGLSSCQSAPSRDAKVRIPSSFGRFPNSAMLASPIMRLIIKNPIQMSEKSSGLLTKTFRNKINLDTENGEFYDTEATCTISTQKVAGARLNPVEADAYYNAKDFMLEFVSPTNDIEYAIQCYTEGPNKATMGEAPSLELINQTFKKSIEAVSLQSQ